MTSNNGTLRGKYLVYTNSSVEAAAIIISLWAPGLFPSSQMDLNS